MKSLATLLEALLADAGGRCDAPFRRDIKTILRRVEYEGDSFLTITLPRFCQVFERALDSGEIGPSDFSGLFSRAGRFTRLPAFLQGFVSKVFDSTGRLLDKPSSDCILCIRQICLMFKKIERPCKDARLLSAEESFIKCEHEVSNTPKGEFWDTFQKVCRIVMSDIASVSMYEELVPRHGPGTTAEMITGNSKYLHRRWHSRLEKVFPFTEFGIGSLANLAESSVSMPDFIEPEDEEPVRVVFVPKTMKTPRVIAIEPVCMQYAQQAILQWIVPAIEAGRFTSGHVNFRDQSVNQVHAYDSSSSGKYATLDMSEASDRVSLAMAEAVYAVDPFLRDLCMASRSRRAKLPSGRIIDLKKFASMGSALCFPTEALAFYCAIISSRILRAKMRVDSRSVFTLSRDVYVYGDDLIIPADEASVTCFDLEAFGLKVNRHKSFWTGKFRESCGKDYYDKVDVTPCYIRRDLPSRKTDASGIISLVSSGNQFERLGYWRTSAAIKEAVEELVGFLPTVEVGHPALGWTYYSAYVPPTKYDVHLQRTLIRCYVPHARSVHDPLEGDGALVKCFNLIGRKSKDLEHLLKTVGRGHLTLKVRWVPQVNWGVVS